MLDLTERKRAEDERRAHLWFLESMDRINRAIQGTSDLERMMSEVLDAVLEVFACDRAWLIYPCDPHAPSWRVVMEHTRPEYPEAFALQTELPRRYGGGCGIRRRARCQWCCAVPAPFRPQGPGAGGGALCDPLADRHGGPSQGRSSVHARYAPVLVRARVDGTGGAPVPGDRPAARRRADEPDAFRSLRESERRLEEAQRIAHVGYWDGTYSGYTTVSAEACRIFGLELDEGQTSLTQQHERLRELVHPEDRPRTAQAAAIALNAGPRYDVEYRLVRPDGDMRIVHSLVVK